MKNKIMAIFVAAMLVIPATIFASVSDDQVTSIKIKEADGTTGQNTNTGSGVKTGHIQDGAVTDAKISGVIAGAKLGSHGHSAADLADGTVTTSKLADGVVTEAKIGGLISASKIDATGLASDTVDGLHASDLASVQHGHEQADVTGLDATLSNKAEVSHTHDELQGKYANVIVVAKSGGDFTNPLEAFNSISGASESNNYLIKVMPGVYDIGANYFLLKPYIDVVGEGIDITKILSRSNTGFMFSANGSFRNLTLETLGYPDPTTFAYGVSFPPQGNTTIKDLKVIVSGHDNKNIAVFAQIGTENVIVENVIAIAKSAVGTNYAIHSEGTSLKIRNSRAIANGLGWNVAINLSGPWYNIALTDFELFNVEALAVDGAALVSDFANVEIFSSILELTGQKPYTNALSLNRGGIVQIDSSVIKTNSNAVYNAGIDQLNIANTKLFGSVNVSANTKCLNAYTNAYVLLDAYCQ